jgi:MFS family permease
MYVKGGANAAAWIVAINVLSVSTGVLGVVWGKIANSIRNKTNVFIASKLLQAFLYVVVIAGISTGRNSFLVLLLLINLLSDAIGSIANLLVLPIIQTKLSAPDERQKILGFIQSVGMLLAPIGQAAGVSFFAITGNVITALLVNAGMFLLSWLFLAIGRGGIQVAPVEPEPSQTPNVKKPSDLRVAFRVLTSSFNLPIAVVLIFMVVINAIGGSFDGVVNLYLLDRTSTTEYGILVIVVSVFFIAGSVLGATIVHDFLHNWSIQVLAFAILATMGLFFALLYLNVTYYVWLPVVFVLSYLYGKLNPRLTAALMDNTTPETLAGVSGMLNSLASVSLPLGTVVILSSIPIFGVSIVTSVITVVVVLLMLFLLVAIAASRKNRPVA